MQNQNPRIAKRQDLLKTNLINFLAILKSWGHEAKELGHNTTILEAKLNETANAVSVGTSSIVSSKFNDLTKEFWPQIEAKKKQSLIDLLEEKKGNDPLLCSISSLLSLKGFVTLDKEDIFWYQLCGFVSLCKKIQADMQVPSNQNTLVVADVTSTERMVCDVK